jgi:hypothetical protein
VFVYDAGPGGYGLYRYLSKTGHPCWVVCPTPAQPLVFPEYVRSVNDTTERLQRLEPELKEQVASWRLQPVVDA